ncbi:MAG TPA: alpha/beta hydrolase [Solirubrobacteraceae bacterium]|nr:alpha/beta hydrolase [Solirubrobacteraceae bacterium]
MEPAPFELHRGGTLLRGDTVGEGTDVVLAHGLTATRTYVLLGSRALERSGHRVVRYDARGHGTSGPAAGGAYDYGELAADLIGVLDESGAGRAVIVGSSMGAHTAVRAAAAAPGRVAALALVTPAFDPDAAGDYGEWDRLAEGLRAGGAAGFVAAYDLDALPDRWRGTVRRVLEQRIAAHEHPGAVADALEAVPRSRPFESWRELEALDAPAIVIATRDEADPGHPLATAASWAEALGAPLHVEQDGGAPLAWQGGRVSALIAELAARTG